MSETDQTKAKASMEALRQEIRIFPEFDYKTALNAPVFQNPVRQAVSQFFANAPDFDFRSSNIDTYLAEHSQTAFKDIDPRYIGDIYTPMRRFRRVLQIFPESIFQVIPELRAMTILMDAGFDSAHSIASLSPSAFVEQIQDGLGSETQARMVYAKAKQIDALTMNTFVHIRQHLNDVSPMVIGSVDQPTLDIIKTIPDWATLFGSLELCDCEECR